MGIVKKRYYVKQNADFKIYLAGKMTDLSIEEMSGWRDQFVQEMHKGDAEFLLKPFEIISPADYFNTVNDVDTDPKQYIRWELRAVLSSDLIVARISEGQDSLGTMAEITAAFQCGVPILLYNPDKIPHEEIHPFVWYFGDACFEDIGSLQTYIFSKYL